jgi:ligand-binding sensor domain-containing protein/signal transduction histidine kinase
MNSGMKTVKFLSALTLIFLFFQSDAQTYKPVNISLSEGLAQSSVYSIVQDKQGFIWMATQDGLNRYDGLQFKIFRENPFDTTTLSSSYITALLVDHNGWLWVGTQTQGLNLFIPSTSQFRHFFSGGANAISHNNINDIYEDASGIIWVSTVKGFSRITINGNDPLTAQLTFKNYYKLRNENNKEKEEEITVNKIYADRANNIWIGARDGLYSLNFTNDIISKVNFFSSENGSGISNNSIHSMCEDANGNFWIGTSAGLNILDKSTGKIVDVFKKDKNLVNVLRSEVILTLFSDATGNLWIGTDGGGLFELKKEYLNAEFISSKMEHIRLGNERLTTAVLSLSEDKINPGLIWIGTFAGGSYKLVPVLKNFYSDHLEYAGVESPVVTCLLKDNNGFIWLGTQNGLIRQNKKNGEIKIFKNDKKSFSMMANYISSILKDNQNNLWIGTEMGVQRIENASTPSPKFISYFIDAEKSKRFIRSLYLDNQNDLFIIFRNSIFKYNREKDAFLIFLENPDSAMSRQRGYNITSMLIDRQHNCWVGSTMGLVVFRNHSGKDFDFSAPEFFYHNLKDTNTLRSQSIQSIMEDTKGNIWLSTSNGLTKAYAKGNKIKFTNYSTADKIKNNTVYAAVEDATTSMIWLSTNGGLTRFDPNGKTTVNFDLNDGLQSNEFNAGAYSSSADGEIFFGGIQGYTSFYPAQIKLDVVQPKVYITDFIIPGNRKPFMYDASGNKSISLKYFENSFAVDFIALHYHDPIKNQYAYKLEGFQQDWTYCGNLHQVNFSQLPPGEYIFKVMASNNDGFYNRQGDALKIIIRPPFFKTIWFYLALLAFVAIILWLLHIYRLQMKLAQIKEVERIRKETAADFHDELGHKLTTISWFSEILKKKIKPEQAELKSYLDKIIETSGSLYLTMKDLLWAMDPEKDSLFHMYAQLKNFGEELFDHTGIEFNANGINDELKNYDLPLSYKRHILLIFKEVMHNSLKHAQPVSTFLDLEKTNGTLTLRFGDNGKGFDMSNGSMNGNGIKNVKRRAEIIHAITHLRSNGTGTLFELKLNMN